VERLIVALSVFIHLSAGKRSSRKSICRILYSSTPKRLKDGLLVRPSTAGRSQDVGVLNNHAPRCKSQNTKQSEIRFHTMLGDGTRGVRFEWEIG